MAEKFLKRIIAQNQEDLRVISALCSEAKIKQSDIKFLKKNKIFLISLEREKSKNIDQNNKNNILELLAIDLFKKNKNFEIVLLFSNNGIITLEAEVLEVELDNIEKVNDKN